MAFNSINFSLVTGAFAYSNLKKKRFISLVEEINKI